MRIGHRHDDVTPTEEVSSHTPKSSIDTLDVGTSNSFRIQSNVTSESNQV